MEKQWIDKPLGSKSYGSIGHLPGSRLGPGDHKITGGQEKILLKKKRDKHDKVIVQEKLDGSNVCVARIDEELVPLIRAGYRAAESSHLQHRYFAEWAFINRHKFAFLKSGERICGEWLSQVHSIHYNLKHDPFVAFDIIRRSERIEYNEFCDLCISNDVVMAYCIHIGESLDVPDAMQMIGEHGFHGAVEIPEGAVWRVERKSKVDFLGKYVRSDKIDGQYFENIRWNWRPESAQDAVS